MEDDALLGIIVLGVIALTIGASLIYVPAGLVMFGVLAVVLGLVALRGDG